MEDEQQEQKVKRYRQKYFDFKNGSNLVKFIKLVPNLDQIKYRLSEEQQKIVGDNNNLVVIGRSGTGKTTCALMRMFAIQILYKNRQSKARALQVDNSKGKLKINCIQDIYGLRNIFLTASPYLIAQIQNKYSELTTHVLKEISNKEKRERFQLNGEQQAMFNLDKQPDRVNRFGFQQLNQLEEEVHNRQANFNCLESIPENKFPGFFHTSLFLTMIDGSLARPFFVRDQHRSRIKDNKFFNNEDNKYAEFRISRDDKEMLALECDYDYFKDHFWEQNVDYKKIVKQFNYTKQTRIKFKEVTPIVAWAEIISVIKGSCQAYSQQNRHLTQEQYLQQNRNIYYGQIEKKAIYEIFLTYERWKRTSHFKVYDIMDLVNHILYQTEVQFNPYHQGSSGFINQTEYAKLHYLFLDQVQDLPPAQIYLISRMFNDGLYFSGDTAQAIQKGVSFKFSDITQMFHPKFPQCRLPFDKPRKHELTFNFRSHNCILMLANNIIHAIQKLFPKSIDSLKKESSQIIGPKPFYMKIFSAYDIKFLLMEGVQTQLDTEQAIIVRDQQAKKKLPKELQQMKGMRLTVEQAKGSQFNDVIIFNFFNPKLKKKWKVLKHLDIYPKRGVKQFHLQQLQTSEYDQLIIELKMLYTSVTRARCTLIICDDNVPEQFIHIWKAHTLLQQQLLTIKNDIEGYRNQIFKQRINKATWDQRGFMFYQRKNYQQAFECYAKAEMYNVCQKIRAVQDRQKAEELLHFIERNCGLKFKIFQEEQQILNRSNEYNQFVQKIEKQVFPIYQRAAYRFKDIKINQSAGRCFFIIRYYRESYICYQQCDKRYMQLGCCEQKLHLHKQAALNFKKVKEYKKMIYNLLKLDDDLTVIQLLRDCDLFEGREYYYRIHLSRHMNKKYQHIDRWMPEHNHKIAINFNTNITTIKQFVKVIEWQTIINKIKDQLTSIAKINASDKNIKTHAFYSFFRYCEHQSAYFATQSKIQILQQKIQSDRIDLIKCIRSYPSLFYYPSDKQVYIEIQKEINIMECQEQLQFLKEKMSVLRLKEVHIFQPINIQLWLSLEYLRKQFLDILAPCQILTRQLFSNFSGQMQYLQRFFYCKSYHKFPISPSQFQKQLKIVFSNSFKLYQQFSSIFSIQTKIQLYRQKNKIMFKQKLDRVYNQIFRFLKQNFTNYLEQNKSSILNETFQLINQIDHQNVHEIGCLNHQVQSQRKDIILMQENKQICQSDYIIVNQGCKIPIIYMKNKECKKHRNQSKITIKPSKDQRYALLHHMHLFRLSALRNLQLGKVSLDQLEVLYKLEIICPRAAISYAFQLCLHQRCIYSMLSYFSLQSKNYISNAKFVNNNIIAPSPAYQYNNLLDIINPEYFNFQMQRTRFRKQNASNELFQGLLLLGFGKYVAQIAQKQYGSYINWLFMQHSNIFQFTDTIRQDLSEKQSQLLDIGFSIYQDINKSKQPFYKNQFQHYSISILCKSSSLIQQFLMFDLYHEETIFYKTYKDQFAWQRQQHNMNRSNKNDQSLKISIKKYYSHCTNLHPIIANIFITYNLEPIMNSFIQLMNRIVSLNEQQLAVLLIIYFSYQNYHSFQALFNQNNKSQFKQFRRQVQRLNSFLNKGLFLVQNYKILSTLLGFFKCRLIHDIPCLQILDNFVIVHKSSFIFGQLSKNSNQIQFCFNFDQQRNVVVMTFLDFWRIISKFLPHLSEISQKQYLLYCLRLQPQKQDNFLLKVSQDQNTVKVLCEIQNDRVNLLKYFWSTPFLGHQSFYFVYHQLKCYYDLLVIMKFSNLSSLAIEQVKEEIEHLKQHFGQWRPYANMFQVYRKI